MVKNGKLITLHTMADKWSITYQAVWKMYINGRLPEPDGDFDKRPFWFTMPKRPDDKRRWSRVAPKEAP